MVDAAPPPDVASEVKIIVGEDVRVLREEGRVKRREGDGREAERKERDNKGGNGGRGGEVGQKEGNAQWNMGHF